MRELGVDVLRREQTTLHVNQRAPIRGQKAHFALAVMNGDPVAIAVFRAGQDRPQDRVREFADSVQGGLDLSFLDPGFGSIGKMLGGTAPAAGEQRTGRRHAIGRRGQDFQQLGPGEGLVLFRDDGPDGFPRSGKRNKNHLTVVAGHPFATVGDFVNGQLNRTATGRRGGFQYQLSVRSAGGTGSTCPVSWAGIFIDWVGMKKVPISIAPTPVSMTTRDNPWAMPTV